MYGTSDRRQLRHVNNSNQQNLMTNLNSISSSLSSIDTISRRTTNPKTSVDNLMAIRRHSLASTSLLWPNDTDDRRLRNSKFKNPYKTHNICLTSRTALNFTLVTLLLLTVARQVFDFLGQIWLQILINFFTIILIIVALFGVHQSRKSYLALFSIWSIINTCWNFIIICIHTKVYDVHLTEDNLNFFTGTTSWWHSNGPGCLPYNITSIQAAANNQYALMQPYAITGCRIDYHFIESSQAAIHLFMSSLAFILCFYVMCVYSKRKGYYEENTSQLDHKLYHLNPLPPDRSRVDSNPFPGPSGSKISTSASLRRPSNKTGARSSQHSMSSMRSTRRRLRRGSDNSNNMNATTSHGSASSAQKNYKTGSLSSRRSRRSSGKRSDQSSMTYATAGSVRGGVKGQPRGSRLSSLSSADYLPSYQPPHSSNAHLLSSYGELSSLDSYNNHIGNTIAANSKAGNSNPTYSGSRYSLYSHGSNTTSTNKNVNGNYDNLSYIYGNSSQNGAVSMDDGESLYNAASSGTSGSKNRPNQAQQTEVKFRRSSLRYHQKDPKTNGNNHTQMQQQAQHVSTYHRSPQSANGANEDRITASLNGNIRYDQHQVNYNNHINDNNNHNITSGTNNNNYDTQNHNNGDTIHKRPSTTTVKHHPSMKMPESDYLTFSQNSSQAIYNQRQSPVYFNSETPI